MQQSIESIKGGMIYLDMDPDQFNVDCFVDTKSTESVEKEIIKLYNDEHNAEVKISHLTNELKLANSKFSVAQKYLKHFTESYRKIQRPMPEKPQWEEVEQNDRFVTSMPTLLHGSEETLSETATNPYVVAGLSSGY